MSLTCQFHGCKKKANLLVPIENDVGELIINYFRLCNHHAKAIKIINKNDKN